MYNIVSHTNAFSIGSGILNEGYFDSDILSLPVECNSDDVMELGWIKLSNRKLSEEELQYIKYLEESLCE